ncbi:MULTISPECIES: hypothetical protein [Kitasatospora]
MTDERARLQHLALQAGIGLETFWLDWLDQELDGDLGET